LKVTSLSRYTETLLYLCFVNKHKYNKVYKSVNYDNKKDPYLHGLKNIESDESE